MSSRVSSIIPGTGTSTILTKEFGWASIFSGSVWTSYVAWSCRGCALWSWVGDVAPLPCADTSVDWHPCVVSPCSAVEPPTAFPLCGHWCGCPCRDPPVCPPMPRQDGIGDKAPTLCCACACVASSWHAHSTIWNCGVANTGADGHECSALFVKKCSFS